MNNKEILDISDTMDILSQVVKRLDKRMERIEFALQESGAIPKPPDYFYQTDP
jgi:hypothetical protein